MLEQAKFNYYVKIVEPIFLSCPMKVHKNRDTEKFFKLRILLLVLLFFPLFPRNFRGVKRCGNLALYLVIF